MGIFDFIGKQFVDVIEWTEETNGVLAYRYPMKDQEIQNGAQLTVRETQLALFVNEGVVADQFAAGLHTLTTRTLPILTNLKNWDKAFASPFKSDIYFFSTREQLDQKWGTPTAITIRDKEFGPLRVQAYGTYSFALSDPQLFYKKVSGTRDSMSVLDVEGQLRANIITRLSSFLGGAEFAFIDMAANQLGFSETLKAALHDTFASYGLTLRSFQVQSISLPAELQARLDESTGMRILGDLGAYTQFQAAQSISIAAGNEGGVAGAGAGLGAGVAMGQAMAQAFSGTQRGASEPSSSDDPLAAIERLHDLFKKGVLSETEFATKKGELLKRIK